MAKKSKPAAKPKPAQPERPGLCKLLPSWKTSQAPIYVGIDPGKTGGVGVIFPNGVAWSWPSPFLTEDHRYRSKKGKRKGQMVDGKKIEMDLVGMATLFRPFAVWERDGYRLEVILERVQAMPFAVKGANQGASSTFALGEAYGAWKGILGAFGWQPKKDYPLADPGRWKPAMGLSSDKSKSLPLCLKLYPKVGLHLAKHCDQAEAVLLAHYYKHVKGTQFDKAPARAPRTGAKPARPKKPQIPQHLTESEWVR